MHITPVQSYPYGGRLYSTEIEAIEAAIHEVGLDLKRNYFHDPAKGLLRHSEPLAALLSRHLELLSPAPQAGKAARKKRSGEPKGAARD